MNKSLRSALLFKDWSNNKKLVGMYFICAVFACMLNFIPGESASFFASIVLLTVFMTFYCHLALKLSLLERKDQNHLFLMTLPLSAPEYFRYKMMIGIGIFVLMWLFILGLLGLIILSSERIPSMLFSLYSAIFLLYLPSFLIVFSSGLLFKNESTVIFMLVASNSLATIGTSIIGNHSSVQLGFKQGTFSQIGFIWPEWMGPFTLTLLTVACICSLLTVALGSRKNHF